MGMLLSVSPFISIRARGFECRGLTPSWILQLSSNIEYQSATPTGGVGSTTGLKKKMSGLILRMALWIELVRRSAARTNVRLCMLCGEQMACSAAQKQLMADAEAVCGGRGCDVPAKAAAREMRRSSTAALA